MKNSNEIAEELLQTYLTPLQREMRQKTGFFYVRSMAGEYWILGHGWSAYQCDTSGAPLYVRQAAPEVYPRLDELPAGDRVLAQFLALTTQRGYFEGTACKFPVQFPVSAHLNCIRTYFGRFIQGAQEAPPPTQPTFSRGLWGVRGITIVTGAAPRDAA